jgi:hypothetical protein
MFNQFMAQLTTKRIIIILAFVAIAIYIVWYVIDALEGFDPNYKPYKDPWQSGAHVGNESFDPNKTPTVDSQK